METQVTVGPTPEVGAPTPANADDESSLAWELDRSAAFPFDRRYASQEVIGSGGMGEVRLLKDCAIGREVAGKFLHTKMLEVPRVRARFMREACIQGRLEHPSIVPVHDVGVAPDGQPYFTMKRVRGMTLREVLDGLRRGDPLITSRFSRRKLLTAFSNVCLTIAFAHERGVIHRDLKPSNIMLGDFGETYVLDWGIAKLVGRPDMAADDMPDDAVLDAGIGGILGTPGYMAPEQAGGPAANLGFGADVYALGAVLFEILTLEPLHVGKSRSELLRATLEGANACASERAPDQGVPPELERICVRACHRKPEDRFHSVRAMHNALEHYLDGDRDLTLRRELANTQVEMAEVAHTEAKHAQPELEAKYRSFAIASLGRALALDADNSRAMKRLVEVLLERPRFVPPEVERGVEALLKKSQGVTSASITLTCLGILLGFPMFLMIGVRDWTLFLTIELSVVAVLAGQLWLRFASQPGNWVELVSVGLGIVGIGLSSRMFGPFILTPALLLVYLVTISVNPSRSFRRVGLALSLGALVVPCLLEIVGLISPSYHLNNEQSGIVPHVLDFHPTFTPLVLLVTHVFLLGIIGLGVDRFRYVIHAAEERAQLFAWQLRQLLPREQAARFEASQSG